MFGLFKKTDPVCGMKERKGHGLEKGGKWFCSQHCLETFEKQGKEKSKQAKKRGCC